MPARYIAEGLHVVDTESGRARVCECATEDFARRTAVALNLLAKLEAAETAPLSPEEARRIVASLNTGHGENAPT